MSPKSFLTLNNAQFFLHNHPHHYKCCLGLMLVAAALQYLAWCPKKPRRHPNVTSLIGMIHSIYVFYTRISCKMHFPGDAGDRHYCHRHLHLSPHPWLCYQKHIYLKGTCRLNQCLAFGIRIIALRKALLYFGFSTFNLLLSFQKLSE